MPLNSDNAGIDITSTLFVFAHQAEAQVFMTHWKVFPIPSTKQLPFKGLYQKNDDKTTLLLITGEGEDWVAAKCASVLALYLDRIKKVVNMGIAGAIFRGEGFEKHEEKKEKVGEIGDIYAVKNVFKQSLKGEKLALSLNLCDQDGRDCVTVASTILDSYRQYDDAFVLIDRELWGIAVSCTLFKLPLYSYKIISDVSGGELGEIVNVQEIKAKALSFSHSLFTFLLNS